jgi:hypothetical protein
MKREEAVRKDKRAAIQKLQLVDAKAPMPTSNAKSRPSSH